MQTCPAKLISMHRFRVQEISDGDLIVLQDAEQVHHVKDVLRLAKGDEIIVFDDAGQESLCAIDHFHEKTVTLSIKERKRISSAAARLTIACALPKRGMDEIIDKLTQLGVDTIIPMQTSRVVIQLDKQGDRIKLARWQRVAQSAAEQSQRSRMPEITGVTPIEEIIADSIKFDLKLIPHLSGQRRTIAEVVGGTRAKDIIALIGPEGDFSPDEIDMATAAGFIPASLGAQVLRVDTAAIAVAAYVKLALN
jgi:16S rRNA (uracil1498-N3)-methyltransferase